MSAVVQRAASPPQEAQRLSATLVLSTLLHALLILGVGFSLSRAAPVVPTMDVILTRSATPLTPKQADFLAQASNQGGGEHDKASRPSDDQVGLIPQEDVGVAPRPLVAQAPAPQPPMQAAIVQSAGGTQPQPSIQPLQAEAAPYPQGQQKVAHDMAMARLAAEYQLQSNAYARRPKRKFVSASTREYLYAEYLRRWVDRAERVGNLNYPGEARRRAIGGVVVIAVAIRRDGTVESARIQQSSHIPMLDEAALRIVRLAAPFPPLPEGPDRVDVLHVTRTWQFLPRGALIDR